MTTKATGLEHPVIVNCVESTILPPLQKAPQHVLSSEEIDRRKERAVEFEKIEGALVRLSFLVRELGESIIDLYGDAASEVLKPALTGTKVVINNQLVAPWWWCAWDIANSCIPSWLPLFGSHARVNKALKVPFSLLVAAAAGVAYKSYRLVVSSVQLYTIQSDMREVKSIVRSLEAIEHECAYKQRIENLAQEQLELLRRHRRGFITGTLHSIGFVACGVGVLRGVQTNDLNLFNRSAMVGGAVAATYFLKMAYDAATSKRYARFMAYAIADLTARTSRILENVRHVQID